MKKKVCFFSSEGIEQIYKQQYSIQDIQILQELGFEVIVSSKLKEIPHSVDLYFGWWATGSILPLLVAKFLRKPIIIIAGGNETLIYKDSMTKTPAGYLAAPWYKKLAARLSIKFADEIVVVSKFMEKGIKEITNRKVKMIHNSVNTQLFKPKKDVREFITIIAHKSNDHWRLKRIPEFLKAVSIVIKDYPDQRFLVLGGKLGKDDLLYELCKELHILKNVTFMDLIPNIEVPRYINRSLCYVQISDTETFGVAVAEALSCNIPVIVSKNGALPEIVRDYGLYVDHNDPKSIASGIIKVIRNYEFSSYESFESREWIKENFSYEKRKKEISKLISTYIK